LLNFALYIKMKMKKIIKILFSLLFVLIVTVVAVPYFFKDDIEKFIKEEINDSVNAKIGYDNVSLSLLSDFPNLHVKINNITVDGVQEFENIRLAHIDELTASLDVKKLFIDKDLEIKKVGIDGADLHILVLKNGKANYDIAKPDTIAQPANKHKENVEVKIEAYQINHSNLLYEDASLNLKMKMKNIRHKGSGVFSASDYKLTTQTSMDTLDVYYDQVHYINRAKADADAVVLIENDFSKYTIKDMLLKLNDLDISSNLMFELKEEDIDIDIDYATQQNSLKKLLSMVPKAYMPDLKGVSAEGKAVLKGFVKGTYNENNYPAYGLDLTVHKGRIQYPDLPQSVEDIDLVTRVDFPGGSNLDKTQINLPKIHFAIAGNTADGRLLIRNPMSDPYIDTQFKSKMDLTKVKQAVYLPEIKKLSGLLDADFKLKGQTSAIEKQEFDKFDASGYFNLKQMQYASDSLKYPIAVDEAKMNIRPQALDLQQLDAQVGESDFHITGKLENYIAYFMHKDKILKARFKLHSNYLNMNEFMQDEQVSSESTVADTTGIIKVPKNVDVNFTADADKMKYKDMDFDHVTGTIVVKDEKAGMETVLLKTLGGDMFLKGLYDTSGETPQSELNLSMKKVSIPQSATHLTMFKTYTPVLKKIDGKMFTDMNFKVQLDDRMNPKLETMDASGLFKTGNLNVGGVDILAKIGNLLKINELKNARVDDVKAQFEIQKGKLFIKPFDFKINKIQSGLQGNVSLDQKINFVLDMDIPRDMLGGKANEIIEGLVGKLDKLGLKAGLGEIIKMKFKITGDMMNPKIIPVIAGTEGNSAQEVITQAVEQKVEEVVEEVKDKAREEAKQKADKLIAEAQLQADKIKAEAQKAADKLRAEAQKQADELIKKAGNDPFKKLAAEAMAKKLKKEADKKATQLETKANSQADLLMKNAREKAGKLLEEKADDKQGKEK